ncbi:unnamed protein product [Didymodactylos carnosus]|uniref:non-specific serine/threonine protein kinase n=1 Tax=Didymodactylos carnosus TaxID=1234261 RepID=A0A814KNF8_9BILA|nr:unnamed protein product [Didymodactylos carnosus]CAF3822615.1 unnamed protein product [Didymodactylos carnosus]
MTFSDSHTNKTFIQFPFPVKRNSVTDDYDIKDEVLGIGSRGEVRVCINLRTKERCALKILKDSNEVRREVILQRQASTSLSSNIVNVRDVYLNEYSKRRCVLLILECMDGGLLFDRIQRIGNENSFTECQAAGLIHSIFKAVHHLHSMNIAHRNIKPENLLFTSAGNDALLKLTDFRFAKECSDKIDKPLITPCYTPSYVAPEILSEKRYNKVRISYDKRNVVA